MNRRFPPPTATSSPGFIEGEGHFGITEAERRAVVRLLHVARAARRRRAARRCGSATRAGTRPRASRAGAVVRPSRRSDGASGPLADCRALVELLDRFELRGRKRREYRDLARPPWSSRRPAIADRRLALRRIPRTSRRRSGRFRRRTGRAGRGSARARRAASRICTACCAPRDRSACERPTPASAIHLRQDDRPLLEMLARATRPRRRPRLSRAYPPAQPSTTWHVARLADVVELASWLDPV